MSELIDVRSKLSPRTHAVLSAVSQASGKEMAELIREMADAWADSRVHEATIVARVLRGEGLVGSSGGVPSP